MVAPAELPPTYTALLSDEPEYEPDWLPVPEQLTATEVAEPLAVQLNVAVL